MFVLELQRILKTESKWKFYQNQGLGVLIVRLSEYNDMAKTRTYLLSCLNLHNSNANLRNIRDAEFFAEWSNL